MTLFILDAHGLLYQLFHALPPMSSPQGEPVGAVFGFAKDLFAIIEKHRPGVLLCAFDMPEKTFRSEIYTEYKANRSTMPEDLQPQIECAKEILRAFNIPILGVSGYEADDILATVAKQVDKRGEQCVIVTADKDCRQCITDNVSLFNLRKQVFYGAEELQNDWGITPKQVVDFQAIVGDATDNVPGVKGIGQKGAMELLQQFSTLEGVYENLAQIKGKKREYLAEHKEEAMISRKLVQLKTDVPIEADWTAYQGFDREKLKTVFQRFGFKSLQHHLAPLLAANGTANETPPQAATLTPTYHLVDDIEKFTAFFSQLKQQTVFSFDTETVPMDSRFEATMPRYTHIAGMSFAWNENEAYYLPFRGPLGAQVLDLKTALETLRPVFENTGIKKVGQNIKYDIIVLHNAGIRMRNIAFDTMLADYLLRPEQLHNLDDMAEHYLGYKTIKIEELIGTGKKQKRMDEVQTDVMCAYAGEDALVAWRLYRELQRRLSETGLQKLYEDIELPLAEILADMEFAGISIDPLELKSLSKQFALKLETLETEINALAGHSFNIASPKQLATVLFDELALPVVRKTKTGQSTDADVLEELALLHPMPGKIMEYRQLTKLKGTYIDALPAQIHPQTGRIHCSFNQAATATGRLSSSNPNLQNIPVRTTEGKAIRHAFKPGAGFDYLLSCDYSQIELRVLAHFCGDENLCEAFRNGEDIHNRVAAEVFNVAPDAVDASMRRTAKAVNFGVIYGQTAFGLSKQLGIDRKEAQNFISGYFERYAGIKEYLNSILDGCIEKGYVETLFGRRRYFHSGTIRNVRNADLNQAERMAVNTVIQGTAADLMKLAMVKLAHCGQLLLQIHDELVFEVKKGSAEELKEHVVQTMLLGQPLNVPLAVDAELTECWE
ncbi:DNA polymerase I [Planctomycetales bacterium]|nr:DNA polymerase I [Planctomycetales bacterium]